MTMNAVPAARCSQAGGSTRASASPTRTAMALVRTSAAAEPRNTTRRDFPEAARLSVASCVLSPSSARKTSPNVAASSFRSMAASFHPRAVMVDLHAELPKVMVEVLVDEHAPVAPGHAAQQRVLRPGAGRAMLHESPDQAFESRNVRRPGRGLCDEGLARPL